MSRVPVLVGMVILSGVLVVGAGQVGGDPPVKPSKVSLPAYWSKAGVAGEQKKKILQVRAKYLAEIDKLRAKIEGIKKEMEIESVKLLTEDQKAYLRKLAGDKFPEAKKTETKKPGEKN